MSAVDPIYNPGKQHQIEEQRRLEDDRENEGAGARPLPPRTPSDMHVFLQTGRLWLRRFTEEDVDHLVELDSDSDVMRFINGGQPSSREEIQTEILPAFLRYYERFAGLGFWAAIEKATGDFVGWFHLRPIEAAVGEVELGYRLHRSAWGKGYATGGSRALIRKGFTDLGVQRVVASTMVVNEASQRVMEKAGLRFKIFHQEWPEVIEGSEKGDVEYALSRVGPGARRTMNSIIGGWPGVAPPRAAISPEFRIPPSSRCRRGSPGVRSREANRSRDAVRSGVSGGRPRCNSLASRRSSMPRERLVRPSSKKMIAGVCAGLADYFGVEARKVRIGFVLFGLFGAGEIVYIALWIIAPKAP